MPKKTLRSGMHIYDLRKADMPKAEAQSLARVIRNAGKRAIVRKQSRGHYAVYVS